MDSVKVGSSDSEWLPSTGRGGTHGVDLAGFALGQVMVLSKEVHCRSLSSIHILYNHTTTARLKPNPEQWYGDSHILSVPAGSGGE